MGESEIEEQSDEEAPIGRKRKGQEEEIDYNKIQEYDDGSSDSEDEEDNIIISTIKKRQ